MKLSNFALRNTIEMNKIQPPQNKFIPEHMRRPDLVRLGNKAMKTVRKFKYYRQTIFQVKF